MTPDILSETILAAIKAETGPLHARIQRLEQALDSAIEFIEGEHQDALQYCCRHDAEGNPIRGSADEEDNVILGEFEALLHDLRQSREGK